MCHLTLIVLFHGSTHRENFIVEFIGIDLSLMAGALNVLHNWPSLPPDSPRSCCDTRYTLYVFDWASDRTEIAFCGYNLAAAIGVLLNLPHMLFEHVMVVLDVLALNK